MTDKNNDEVKVFDDEKSILLDHNYDGIKELNHPLPSWWLTIFYLSMFFAAGYYIYYTFLGGPTLTEEYTAEMAKINSAKDKWMQEQGGFKRDKYNAFIVTAKAKKIGKKTYKRKCRACHAADGGGGVGPNLTDKYWINGNGSLQDIYKIIHDGVEDRGMQAWGGVLSEEKLFAVLKYVMDFQGTTPENPKEPQGKLIE